MADHPCPSDALARALQHLEGGDWPPAHEIVQREESTLAAWLHGIVHTLEGDLDNARYWYRKAGREFPGPSAVGGELAAARQALGASAAGGPDRRAPEPQTTPMHTPKEER